MHEESQVRSKGSRMEACMKSHKSGVREAGWKHA